MTAYVNSIIINSTTFTNKQSIVNVNCTNRKWQNNSMYNAFSNCKNLQSVTGIHTAITNYSSTFKECANLTTLPTIPSTVTNLSNCFCNCRIMQGTINSLPNNVTNIYNAFGYCMNTTINITTIPNSVTNVQYAFYFCTNLIATPTLPNNIDSLYCTFYGCSKLVTPPTIPDSVTSLNTTFRYCRNMTTIPTIPNLVTDLRLAFDNCTNLISIANKPIPTNVTTMSTTFRYCNKLCGDIFIESNKITLSQNCFSDTSLPKSVYIPFKYTNTVNSATYNSFITAGYDTNGTKEGVYLKDINDTATLTINPTPSDSTVTLTSGNPKYTQSGNSITVPKGSSISYSVSKQGYTTQSGILYINADTTTPIDLSGNNYTLTINTNPAGGTVTFDTAGTISGNSIIVPYNTTVIYNVSKPGYVSKNNLQWTVTETATVTVPLTPLVTLTIDPIPVDSTVTLTAAGYTQSGNSITVEPGTNVSYSVSRSQLITQSGSTTVNSTNTLPITLSYPANTVLFESSTAGSYSITTITSVDVNIICVGAGGGACQSFIMSGGNYLCGSAGGGSGGYTNVNINIPVTTTIPINIGAVGTTSIANSAGTTETAGDGGNSNVGSYASATGGKGGYSNRNGGTTTDYVHGGAAGTGNTSNGNAGNQQCNSRASTYRNVAGTGGASVYSTYGKGSSLVLDQSTFTPVSGDGTAGYVKIVTV